MSIDLGKGTEADFDIVSSVFGKNAKGVIDWINKGKLKYVDKRKALNYLHLSAPIAEALDKTELNSATKIVESFENPKLTGENLSRDGSGAYSDAKLSAENDPAAKMGVRRTAAQQREFAQRERQRMEQSVRETARQLNLPNVDIITDTRTLTGRKARAKGFFNPRTGRITIVIPNHASASDALQTLLHEAVAHYGLRQLFGSRFDTFLDNVYSNASHQIRRKIADMAARRGWDFRTATEEYLATLAEQTDFERAMQSGWWSRIKRMFLDMLHSLGLEGFTGVTLTDNELRYILWRSYENLAEPGHYRSILGEAADVARQYQLRVGNFSNQRQTADNEEASVAESPESGRTDNQGNPVNADGSLKAERVKPVSDLRDYDFISPTRNVQLPPLPEKVDAAIGAKGKPVVIKKNIFIKNRKNHKDLMPEQSRRILTEALYSPDLYGQNQKTTRPYNWILVNTAGKHSSVILEVNHGKDNVEIVNWHYLDDATLRQKERQALKEGGLILTLESAAGNTHQDLSSDGKVSEKSPQKQTRGEDNSSPRAWGKDDLVSKAEQAAHGIEPGLLFRDTIEDTDNTARVTYNRMDEAKATVLREAWQDSMVNLRNLQEAVLKQRGETAADYEDAYSEENRSHGRSRAESEFFTENLYKPLITAVGNVAKKAGVSVADVVQYMMAKHGLERNEVFARRDGKADYEAYTQKHLSLHPDDKRSNASVCL